MKERIEIEEIKRGLEDSLSKKSDEEILDKIKKSSGRD
jgi:hypothetical protein